MSAGERQRVFLAQATVHRPSLLLLDEPTAAVDPEQRALLRGLLRDWSSGALVLMATHLVEEVQLLGDRVIVLAAGRVMFDGSSAQLAALGEPLRTSDDDQPIEAALRTLRGAADDL
jgi:ABC-2 type transport system ATP-binding protein